MLAARRMMIQRQGGPVANIVVYKGGVLIGTVTDSSPLPGTWVGVSASQPWALQGETWDDFSAHGVADNFNRANSTTTMNPASDGGSWTVTGSGSFGPVKFGIKSNQGYCEYEGSGIDSRALRDTGVSGADLNWTPYTVGGFRTFWWFGYDPATDSGYYWRASDGSIQKWVSGSTVGQVGTLLVTPTSGTAMRIVYT